MAWSERDEGLGGLCAWFGRQGVWSTKILADITAWLACAGLQVSRMTMSVRDKQCILTYHRMPSSIYAMMKGVDPLQAFYQVHTNV
jgi:hypothetical protein